MGYWRRILDFRNWFRRRSAGPGTAASAQPKRPEPAKHRAGESGQSSPATSVGLDETKFIKVLKDVATANKALVAGSMHLIGLTRAKKHFGERWPKFADRVHEIVREVIESRIAEADVYTRHQDTAYVIVFARLDGDQAQLKCALIAEEIARKIFGEGETADNIEVATMVFEPGRDIAFEQLTPSEIVERIMHVRGRFSSVTHVEPSTAVSEAAAGHDRRPTESRDVQAHVASGGSPGVGDERGPSGSAAAAISGDALSHAPKASPATGSVLRFVYQPAWLVKGETISAFTCVPARFEENGTLLLGGAAMPKGAGLAENAEVDHLALRKVVGDLHELSLMARSAVVTVPVHFDTVASSDHSRRYISLARSVSRKFGDPLLFELIHVPEKIPQARLREAASSLSPFSRAVIMRTKMEVEIFDRLKGAGIRAVGVNLGHVPLTETDILTRMTLFNERANQHDFLTFAHGIHTLSLLSAAVSAGFLYIDGVAVATAVEMPGEKRPLRLADIYAPLLTAEVGSA